MQIQRFVFTLENNRFPTLPKFEIFGKVVFMN